VRYACTDIDRCDRMGRYIVGHRGGLREGGLGDIHMHRYEDRLGEICMHIYIDRWDRMGRDAVGHRGGLSKGGGGGRHGDPAGISAAPLR